MIVPVILSANKWKNRYSMLFDGVNEDILLGNNASLNFTGSFSLSAWIYMNSLVNGQMIFFRSLIPAPYSGYGFEVLNSGKLRVMVNGGVGGAGLTVSSTVLAINTWYNVGCTKTAGAAPKIYVSGIETAYDSTSTENPTSNNSNAFIGGTGLGWAGRQFDGRIDEAGWWNTNLSATQMGEIWNGGKPKNLLIHSAAANLVSYHRMGDGDVFSSGNWTIYDKKGTNHGTSSNMESNDISSLVP